MSSPVRIPADVDLRDRVLGPLTARQLTILAGTGVALYCGWGAANGFVPLSVFLVLALPLAAAAAVLALGQRDGISMDRLLLAAIRQQIQPRRRVAAPEGVHVAPSWLTSHATIDDPDGPDGLGSARRTRQHRRRVIDPVTPAPLRLPAEAVIDTGVVDLGAEGLALIAAASTVDFALRTPQEQDSLVASFGRYLHSLTAPIQVLVRTQRLDLSGQIATLREHAGGLPHPALETAAVEHADYLAHLGEQADLLHRQVLLVLREPIGTLAAPTDGIGGPSALTVLAWLAALLRAGRRTTADTVDATDTGSVSARARQVVESRLIHRLNEAIDLLAPAGIVITPLDAQQATAVLTSACNPDTLLPPAADLARAEEVITTAASLEPINDDLTTRTDPGAPRPRGPGSTDNPPNPPNRSIGETGYDDQGWR